MPSLNLSIREAGDIARNLGIKRIALCWTVQAQNRYVAIRCQFYVFKIKAVEINHGISAV